MPVPDVYNIRLYLGKGYKHVYIYVNYNFEVNCHIIFVVESKMAPICPDSNRRLRTDMKFGGYVTFSLPQSPYLPICPHPIELIFRYLGIE